MPGHATVRFGRPSCRRTCDEREFHGPARMAMGIGRHPAIETRMFHEGPGARDARFRACDRRLSLPLRRIFSLFPALDGIRRGHATIVLHPIPDTIQGRPVHP
jgi:hypothetical protein